MAKYLVFVLALTETIALTMAALAEPVKYVWIALGAAPFLVALLVYLVPHGDRG